MIQIEAKLLRELSPVFLAGQTIECLVTFTRSIRPDARDDITLAFASVQFTGYCQTKLTIRNFTVNFAPSRTSLNTGEHSVFSTDPKILFCDLKLNPGESKTFFYRERIPDTISPTFRGSNIKYYYKLNIATQKFCGRVQMLQIPLRILPLLSSVTSLQSPDIPISQEILPSNPFLHDDSNVSLFGMAVENLQDITSHRKSQSYLLKNQNGIIGRVMSFKKDFKLGEDIVLGLDFSSGTVQCVQYIVTLISKEVMKESLEAQETGKKIRPLDKTTKFSTNGELCLGIKTTYVCLPIPHHVTPSFSTDLVELQWQLEFQFTIANKSTQTHPNSDQWMLQKRFEVENMIWTLPINIHSAMPSQLFHPSNNQFKMYLK